MCDFILNDITVMMSPDDTHDPLALAIFSLELFHLQIRIFWFLTQYTLKVGDSRFEVLW